MGKLKQLLSYHGEPLLVHAIRQAHAAGFAPIVVVLGAQADLVRDAIQNLRVEIVYNNGWQSGMGSSIATGVRNLNTQPDGVAILTGDQPLVTAEHLREMHKILHSKDAVAAEYSGTIGVPAIFSGTLINRLIHLPPASGAKGLLQAEDIRVAHYPLAEAALDIDTPSDWEKLASDA
jgi:molybdenum cofactor cytidylyltransferase